MSFLASVGNLSPKKTILPVIAANMFFRPMITMSNKSLPPETRKYTATREFSTEFFGLINTYTFVTIVEKFVPKFLTKALFKTDLTDKLIEKLNDSKFSDLKPLEKNIKGLITLTGLAGTIISIAIIVPLLNNLVLNKLLKTRDNNPKLPPESENSINNKVVASNINNNTLITNQKNIQSQAFNIFLKNYLDNKNLNQN